MKRKTETLIRTIVLALALLNQILTAIGRSPLPIADEQVEMLISVGVTVAASLWAWWKNNSVTTEARMADAYMDELKSTKKRWRNA